MFFVVSVLNNYALNFNISMPLHMIFRSVSKFFLLFLFKLFCIWGNFNRFKIHFFKINKGSLIANMVLGIFFLKKKYSIREYVSIVLITAGICICTLASSKVTSSSSQDEDGELVDFIWWIVGKKIECFWGFVTAPVQ